MNTQAISNTGDGGLFQLNNKSFTFHNEQWRFNPVTNIAIALDYLGKLRMECKHRVDNTYVVCYNLGIRGGSKIKNPKNQTYYKKLNLLWRVQ